MSELQPQTAGDYLAHSFEHALVADAMRAGVLTCPPETSLRTVARMMAQYGVHAVVVTGVEPERDGDFEERAWRIVPDAAIARYASAIDDVTAGGAAMEPVVTVVADDPLQRAADLMLEHGTSHVVVTDEATGRAVGILSTLDLARTLAFARG